MSNQFYPETQDDGRYIPQEGFNVFMARVYVLMFIGLIITAGTGYSFSYLVMNNYTVNRLASNMGFFYTLAAAQLLLVFFLSSRIERMSEMFARLLYLVYAVVLGVFLSYIFLAYTTASIVAVFGVTAGVFAVMAIYGFVTKADLTSAGRLFIFGLFGIIIAGLINMFIRSSMLDFVLCIIGLGVFLGLVAYDTQKIKRRYYEIASSSGEEMTAKYVIFAALTLYLDFINIFLRLIRLFGKRR